MMHFEGGRTLAVAQIVGLDLKKRMRVLKGAKWWSVNDDKIVDNP
jgi:hypothetical protein